VTVIRPTFAQVDLGAIRANLRAVAGYLARGPAAPPPDIIAVVKANAYGHGAVPVARTLEAAGAAMLACADIEEGIRLREAGIRLPILVFGALGVSDLEGVFTHALTPTVSTPSAGRALQAAAARHGRRLACHLKIDTGMNRLGLRHDNLRRTLPAIADDPHLAIEAIYTHFATADDPDSPMLNVQRERFERAAAHVGAHGGAAMRRHAAGSAALLRDERTWFDAVRPGLLLYGLVPPPLASTLAIRPAMSLRSRIVAVKGLRPGEGTGYGLRHRIETPITLAVIPAGYADGLDVRLAGRGAVLLRGRRAPIVGSVCMDMLTIDVTTLEVQPGDEVVILGEQDGDRIDVREMAAAIGTIPYEILCRIGSRIERHYVD
jgi:alanine racemase